MRTLLFLVSVGVVCLSICWASLLPTYPDQVEHKFRRYVTDFGTHLAFHLGQMLEPYGVLETHSLLKGVFAIGSSVMKTNSLQEFSVTYERSVIGNTPVLITRPAGQAASLLPGIVYFHGGGWVFGNPDTHRPFTAWLSEKLNVVTISVDYDLLPDTSYEAQLEQCISATKYVFDNAAGYGIDARRILVAGDSAGGNLAAVISQAFVNSPYHLIGNVLISPGLQAVNLTLPSYRRYRHLFHAPAEYFLALRSGQKFDKNVKLALQQSRHIPKDILARLNAEHLNVAAITDYPLPFYNNMSELEHLGVDSKVDSAVLQTITEMSLNWKAWPLLAEDNVLKSLPPTFVQACEFDFLLDDALLYVHRLKKAGALVTVSYLPGAVHVEPIMGFYLPAPMAAPAVAGLNDIYKFISSIISKD